MSHYIFRVDVFMLAPIGYLCRASKIIRDLIVTLFIICMNNIDYKAMWGISYERSSQPYACERCWTFWVYFIFGCPWLGLIQIGLKEKKKKSQIVKQFDIITRSFFLIRLKKSLNYPYLIWRVNFLSNDN
jgi:hypothetical protein